MEIDEVSLPETTIEHLKSKGINELYPPQAHAVEAGVLEGQNLVAAIPTASGKTLISVMAMLSGDPGTSLYIVPLRALASEKYREFKEYPGLDIGITTGDYDERDETLGRHDVVVATSEKADSLVRNGAPWIKELSTLVVDEVHLLDSPDRGPTLEVTIAKLRRLNSSMQVIALSATVSNADTIAGWLDAELIESDWRPVDLHKGVYQNGVIEFQDGEEAEIQTTGDDVADLVFDSVENDGSCLVFVNTRKSTQSVARRLSERGVLNKPDLGFEVERLSSTSLGEELARCIRGGVAFHHAGLSGEQRSIVEESFRDREIKVICATPTLAAGVNVPARRVIVRDTLRYGDRGMEEIPVLEVHQMFGRAGRPGLDPFGEAVISVGSSDKEEIVERYIDGEPEPVYSKLASRPALRSHVLSTVASGFAGTKDGLIRFMENTFYAYQEDAANLDGIIESVVDFLVSVDMLKETGDELEATSLGHNVSRLYIDPLTGAEIMDGLDAMDDVEITELTVLEMICCTPDMYPLYLRGDEDEAMLEFAFEHEVEFIGSVDEFDRGFEEWLSKLKAARVISEWINEVDEEDISERYGVGPGDIYSRVERAGWLLHAAESLAAMIDSPYIGDIRRVRRRVDHGVEDELLELTTVRGIGRVRARKLYEAGIKDVEDLGETRADRLEALLGPKTARSILSEVDRGDELEEISDESPGLEGAGQSSLGEF